MEIYNLKKYNPTLYPIIELKGKSGIYQIRNLVNNKVYIGSTLDFYERRRDHFSLLRSNKYIHHCEHLQNSFNKYGEENFVFEVIEFCESDVRYKSEQYWLDKFYGKNICYNKNPIANSPPIHYGKENPRAKTIICLDDKNIFHTIKDCANYYHIDRSSLNRNIRGLYNKPTRKFTYLTIYNKMLEDNYTEEIIYKKYNTLIIYYDQYLDHIKNKNPITGKSNGNSKPVICLNDDKTFDTIENCIKYYNIDRSSITKNLQGVYKNPKRKFLLLNVYNKMLNDGYNREYIFNNHQKLIIKYNHLTKY